MPPPAKKEKAASQKRREENHKPKGHAKYVESTDDDDDGESCFSGEEGSGSESTDSENDYNPNSLSFVDLNGVPDKLVADAWVKQRGLCRISGMPMSGKTGLYSPIACLRVFKDGIRKGNVIVVCRVIYEMRSATTLPWKQFAQLMKVFGDQIGSDYRF